MRGANDYYFRAIAHAAAARLGRAALAAAGAAAALLPWAAAICSFAILACSAAALGAAIAFPSALASALPMPASPAALRWAALAFCCACAARCSLRERRGPQPLALPPSRPIAKALGLLMGASIAGMERMRLLTRDGGHGDWPDICKLPGSAGGRLGARALGSRWLLCLGLSLRILASCAPALLDCAGAVAALPAAFALIPLAFVELGIASAAKAISSLPGRAKTAMDRLASEGAQAAARAQRSALDKALDKASAKAEPSARRRGL